MPIISLSLEGNLLDRFDKKVSENGYSGRSEALRELIRSYISEQDWAGGQEESVVVVNVLYEKESARELVSSIQHEYGSPVITSLHTHLDKENCMEVFIAKGSARKLKRMIDKIKTVKGVKQTKYITTASNI